MLTVGVTEEQRASLQTLLLFNRPQQHWFLNQEINRRLQRIKCLQLYLSSTPINLSAYPAVIAINRLKQKDDNDRMPSAKTPNHFFSAFLSASCLKKSQRQKKKIRKIKENLLKMSVRRTIPRCSIGNQSPETWNWHHYILMYSTKNTSKAELAKDQHLLPAN